MPHDAPRDEPSTTAARDAATAALDQQVTGVTRIETGVNALFRLDLADGTHAVLKAPRYASESAFRSEPALLERIGEETTVPVPRVLADVPASDSSLETSYYVMALVEGRAVDTVMAVPSSDRPRLVREAATHLAAIHDVSVPERFGQLHATEDGLAVDPVFENWADQFVALTDEVTTALVESGPLTDADPRFADLAAEVEAALAVGRAAVVDAAPAPRLVVRDYRPSNLVLAADDGANRLVAGVFDVSGMVGDALFDVAKTEMALIDVPLGGRADAESLRERFRATYADQRGVDESRLFGDRYATYRLYAMAYRLKAFDYSVQFAREDDPEAVERRWRSFVDDRITAIRGER